MRGVRQFSVVPIDWNEPAVIEERPEAGVSAEEAIEAMREFMHEDCAAEIELSWLLWTYSGGSWQQAPHQLRFTGMGPAFGGGSAREDGQISVDFGLDEAFLADLAPWNRETRQHLQANIIQLLVYAHRLQEQLHPAERRLWSDGESDWTAKLTRRLELASSEAGTGAENLVQ